MARSTTFNWSELTRSELSSYFYLIKDKIVGRKLTPDQIQKIISNHVKKLLPVKVVKVIDASNKCGYIYMGGVYHSLNDKASRAAIELNLNYHPNETELCITNYRYQRMSRRFADIIMHEMIHMRQFRSRNFKMIPGYQSTAEYASDRKKQEYFGDRDEMGAFAFNTACEMIDRFGYDPTTIKRYMDSNGATRHRNSWWYDYLKAFEFNHNHNIIRRMKKKVLRQLENAYYGKPFRTTNHLTY